MADINTSEGALLEALNNKVDVDLSNAVPVKSFTSQSAGWAMPSDSYVDLTLGASGSTYTAPANGYLYINKSVTATQFFYFYSVTKDYAVNFAPAGNNSIYFLFPVSKGEVVQYTYSAAGATRYFRFIYAEGEK